MRLASMHRDDGMNVFEVVFAAFIMFVVLTGVLGLVATSTNMGIDAKQRNLISNTIASRMEYVRGLPFSQVAIATSGGSGVLPSSETFTANGISVTVSYQVQERSSVTKELRVTAVATVPGRTPVTTTAYSIIRDRDQDLTQFTGIAMGPDLVWTATTPDDGSVVYSNLVWNSGGSPTPLELGAEAESQDSDQDIRRMEMYMIGSATELVYLADATVLGADTAEWEWSVGQSSASVSFRWHTGQVMMVDGEVTEVVDDGWQTVRCRAWDSEGNSRAVDRTFYVDNDPPGDSGVPTATVSTDALVTAQWGPGSEATMYDVTQYRQKPAGYGSYTDPSSWDSSPTVTISGLLTDLGTYRFSRYVVTALARSPRLNAANAVPSAPYVTRPLGGGTSAIITAKAPAAIATLTVSPPTFPCTGWTTYSFSYRSGTAGAWTWIGNRVVAGSSPATFTTGSIALTKVTGQWQPLYYRYHVYYTPAGYAGGTAAGVGSDVFGPTPTSVGATATLVHAEW
ncbi:MAG: hypothetical protein FDZ70_01140 [Actinobacteria bacterium]|nr:MAG: hypothetical protein FDZ70_01140 [Actinomycetota bacterium]